MLKRIDKLAEFGSSVITISGGEPMMHPEIYDIIARIRHHGMIAGLISNGYYFQPEKIKKLNEAGLTICKFRLITSSRTKSRKRV